MIQKKAKKDTEFTTTDVTNETVTTKGRAQRQNAVDSIENQLTKAEAVVFTNYQGLSANDITNLRTRLREKGAKASVLKNTLLKIALTNKKVSSTELEKTLKGPTMVLFSFEDAVSTIKTAFEFAKENDAFEIKSGLFEGEYTSFTQLEVLSTLPGKEELLTKVVISMKSPITGFVRTLGGVQRNFVYALSAIAEQKKNA